MQTRVLLINKYIGLGLLLLCAYTTPQFAAAAQKDTRLPAELDSLLKRSGVPRHSYSIFAQRVGETKPLISVNADVARNPASTMKLLTTFVALDSLGPAYTWKTEAHIDKKIKNGVLPGNLYLKGYGDPYMVTEYFWRLLRGMRKQGLQKITGDLVLDTSYFQPMKEDPSAFDGQGHRSYNVQPSALLLNFQSINFRFRPDPTSGRVSIVADPNPGLEIDNRIKLTRGRCRGSSKQLSMRIDDKASKDARDTVRFSGRYSRACGESTMYRVVADAADYVYGVFKNLWREQGGEFSGKLRQAAVPRDAKLYYTAQSLPLSHIIRAINKYSNNVMTRQVLLTLGAEIHGPPGTTEKGLQVVQEWLHQKQLAFPELVMSNGAGLSREARISARHMGQLLLLAYHSPYMPEFMSSLPIAAEDGTLRTRFGASELRGRMHIKTGLIDDVRGMAGYLLDNQGRRVVVVILHNHRRANQTSGKVLQDAILEWLYQRT